MKKITPDLNLQSRQKSIAEHFRAIMHLLKLDVTNPSIADTPNRVAKMMVMETCSGLFTPPPKMTTFPNDGTDQLILIKDITFNSLCEHHFVPFIGRAHVAYFPDKRILGLSKFPRAVKYWAKRPQVQERLTKQIGDFLCEILQTENVAVILEAKHLCCAIRGVEDSNTSTTSSFLGGKFMEQSVRVELYGLINTRG